jgi:Domain of unknown function (DUF4835)
MTKTWLLALILLCFGRLAQGQELLCNVIVNDVNLQTQERQVITQMRDAIQQFMNTTRWTTNNYRQHERIRCTFQITLLNDGSDVAAGRYVANMQVVSSRPVFGTTYETTLLTFFDRNFAFEYTPSQPLVFSENTFSTNLTATLAYYAYAILLLDQDSLANLGGTPLLDRILNILNNSQSASGASGWGSNDTRNRAWISENLNNPQLTPFREALYVYHRQGLDLMASRPDVARKQILEALKKIQQASQVRPGSVMINAFFDSKANELINLFSQGDPVVRKQAQQLLVKLDPLNNARYQALIK